MSEKKLEPEVEAESEVPSRSLATIDFAAVLRAQRLAKAALAEVEQLLAKAAPAEVERLRREKAEAELERLKRDRIGQDQVAKPRKAGHGL